MKKITLLFFVSISLFTTELRSQSFSFTVSQAQQCYLNGFNTASAVVTSSIAGTTNYTWSAVGGSCNATYTFVMGNGSSINLTFPCAGNYTITGFAMNGAANLGTAIQVVTINPVPVITATVFPGNFPSCTGTSYTVVPSGGVSYSINGPGFTFTPLASGCLTVVGSNALGCNGFAFVCYTVQPNPTITVIGPNNLCTGGVATLVAAGAANYTWQPGNLVGNAIVVSPSVTTCYTIVGANANGCTSSVLHCITVAPSLNVFAISSPSVVCAGGSSTLSAGGAATYTWSPGLQTGANIVVTPTVSTCYTVTGASGAGCSATAAVCVIVNSNPVVSIAPAQTICPGSSVILTASGALSYTWSVGSTLSSISVAPLSTTCYSVIGSNANGCSAMAVSCVTVANLPAITFSASSANGSFVCEGSSITYTANGALSYSWSGGSTSPTYSMIAGTFANYTNLTQTVTGLFANGCLGTATVSPWILTHTCSNVWPGDANRDGVVSNTDVFELGLANNATGPARTGASNTWINQFATNWTGTVSTGWNRNHADCNGDGTINNADTVAIFNNFSLSHAFKATENNAVNPDITLTLPATVYAGQWNKADILLGSASAPISQLYGIAFDLGIDQTLLDNNSAYLLYTPSFLNANNQNVEFRKNNLTNGIIHAASVRVDGNNCNGNGKIGELWFKLSATAPNNALLNLSANNGVKINSSGTGSALTGGTASAVVAIDVVGVKESGGLLRNLSVYPNPASNQVSLQNTSGFSVAYSIVDVLGREVLKGEFIGIKNLDVSALGQGAYFIKFESAGISVHKKLVIEKR